MIDRSQPKVIGAFVIGLAIVFGAYTLSNFGKPYATPSETQTATVAVAPERVIIPVIDSNEDGIEDWREDFVDNTPSIYKKEADQEYIVPETLTDQVGISFLQSYIQSEGQGPLGKSKELLVDDTVDRLTAYAADKIYSVRDIIVSNDESEQAVREYANQLAEVVIINNDPTLQHELDMMKEAVDTRDYAKAERLVKLAQVYAKTRDGALSIPVPPQLTKQHLDFINVCNAVYNDIEAMSKSLDDPMLSLIRLKRYEDDALGLAYAMENLYLGIEPYAGVFQKDDSALLFVSFSPNFQ